jgi:hypothetical protein
MPSIGGNQQYFGSKYKTVITSYLSRQNAGISTRYNERPGAFRLLVPPTAEAAVDKLSSLSTIELTEKKVVAEKQAVSQGKRLEEV